VATAEEDVENQPGKEGPQVLKQARMLKKDRRRGKESTGKDIEKGGK